VTGWNPFNPGVSVELTAVWGPSATDLYVSGASGTILRYDGLTWAPMATGTTEYLWSITGDPEGKGGGFAVGFNSTLVTGLGPAAVGAMNAARAASTASVKARSLEPSKTALMNRTSVRSLPQGAARRSVKLSHSAKIRSSARPVKR
jgi:hypothetical protein